MTKRIEEAQKILSNFTNTLSKIQLDSNFSRTIDIMLGCKGKIITTGMGKAGIAMRKFSSILCSVGFPSCYLHPGEASHGDLGILSEQDILFVASTSGKTREVLEIIKLARNIGIKMIIGITSHPDSPVRDQTDVVIDMGVIKEAGRLGLAPTTSIIVMLALTDCLALVASEERNLTKEQYGKYHHSGYLGALARSDGKIH
jgi:arabinose-5-phosphate isomerase